MELSGAQWCARFPGSNSVDDLRPAFRRNVRAFLGALKDAGARVRIAATFRPPERAWLMHWCWLIGHAGQDPAHVPRKRGVDICWLHETPAGAPDIAASRAAARAMARGYAIRYPAAIVSRHTQRRAIDMTIGWKDFLDVRDGEGTRRRLAARPLAGAGRALIGIGRTYGVMKLIGDPPHWSDDGH
jgi:hypothetical protein